jgi:hypothetical protein
VSTVLREKRTDWSRLYEFDFADFDEVVQGETLSAPSVPAVSGLTIGAPSVLGAKVLVRISGGTAGTLYNLSCSVTTSGGSTISQAGVLSVVS